MLSVANSPVSVEWAPSNQGLPDCHEHRCPTKVARTSDLRIESLRLLLFGSLARELGRSAGAETMTKSHGGTFKSTLFRYPGKGGWHFAPVPDRLAPPVSSAWGRTPVEAIVDGVAWRTSVWRGTDGRTLLAVPAKVRGAKGDGDQVRVTLRFSL